MLARELLHEGAAIIGRSPRMATINNKLNILTAARFKWQQEEMGGAEHVQFALRNNTPIVPLGHAAHPIELVRKGFVDGKGWTTKPKISISKWPNGQHWYAYVDGREVIENGVQKWNTPAEAEEAALRVATKIMPAESEKT